MVIDITINTKPRNYSRGLCDFRLGPSLVGLLRKRLMVNGGGFKLLIIYSKIELISTLVYTILVVYFNQKKYLPQKPAKYRS